jgi:5-methylcytosine-specific restriction endonuclease McrA
MDMHKKRMIKHIRVHTPKTTVAQLFKAARIPKAIREQTWIRFNGENYKAKCHIAWCTNIINPFTFEVGHNMPHSKGGSTEISNLRPICSRCNKSMGDKYTIDEFSRLSSPVPQPPIRMRWFCFPRKNSASKE